MSLILKAARFAQLAHSGQMRKHAMGEYIHHPKRVAGDFSLEAFASPISVAACWLHDTVEDTSVTYDDIRQHFGFEVEALVRDLTFMKDPQLPRAENKRIQCERLARASYVARVIKCYDRWDNLNDLDSVTSHELMAFRRQYAIETLDLLTAVRLDKLAIAKRLWERAAFYAGKTGLM